MTKRLGTYFILLLAISSLMFAVSCAKTKVKSEPAGMEVVTEEEMPADMQMEEMEEGEGLTEEQLSAQELAEKEAVLRDRFVNQDIHFEFDKSRLIPEAKEILKEKAEWLSIKRGATVTIEGHCDERGTNEYNLALGDRRAESAKRFLVDLGISASRLTTVTYGEERPLDPGHNEEAWTKNRRARFVIE
ncbi:MAG: peptidoglycan-associated lipoprotein Pal [Deltaproteobacteria bacterium]|nr:peptidoglycan-associated lipoprotein Pal [Deltaproteobacteria bacterium]